MKINCTILASVRILSMVAYLCTSAPLHSQEQAQPVVSEGSRVRVTGPLVPNGRITGTLQNLDADTLWILQKGAAAVTPVPVSACEALEVSLGFKRHTKLGGAVGLLVGVGAAIGIIELLPEQHCYGFGECIAAYNEAYTYVLLGMAAGAGVGFLAGSAVGHGIKTDIWDRVRLPRAEPIITLRPDQSGHTALTVGLRLRI